MILRRLEREREGEGLQRDGLTFYVSVSSFPTSNWELPLLFVSQLLKTNKQTNREIHLSKAFFFLFATFLKM